MTVDELRSLPIGTPIRVIKTVRSSKEYRKGGYLTIQPLEKVCKKEYWYGISVKSGKCFQFHAREYEIIHQK